MQCPLQARCPSTTPTSRSARRSTSTRCRATSTGRRGSLARRPNEACEGIVARLQALARKANAEGRLVTIFDVGEFKYIDDVEALALLGPLALTSLAGIR